MESKDSLFSEGLKVFAQLFIISNILFNSCDITYINHNRDISILHHSTKLGSVMSLVVRIQDVQVHFQKGKIIHKNVLMEPMPNSYQAQPLQVMIFLRILSQKTKNVYIISTVAISNVDFSFHQSPGKTMFEAGCTGFDLLFATYRMNHI